jgi:hypothetical protein
VECIDEVLLQLKEADLDLEEEDDVAGFLGVNKQRDDKSRQIHMTRFVLLTALLTRLAVIWYQGNKLLLNTKLFAQTQGTFSYARVIGMLQYLQGQTPPDNTLAVSQCTRFIHSTPRRSHESALIRIGQYLNLTWTKGQTLRPMTTMGIDCYVNADFVGLRGLKNTIPLPLRAERALFFVLLGVQLFGQVNCNQILPCLQWRPSTTLWRRHSRSCSH